MKRFISLLLTFCMVLSLFAGMGSVFAADSTKTLLNLDFENETDLNALTVKNGNASREAENPALELRPSPNAFRVKYIPTATVGNMELSFKLKNSGSARDSVSAWIYNNGSENGYRAILASDKIVLSHYENGNYQDRIDDAEQAMAAGYRDTWHTYTLKRVENTLSLSVDGSQLLSTTVSENATLENGICFSAWNDAILIDDLSLKTLSAAGEAESTILDLTFTDENDQAQLTKDNWGGYAANQQISRVTNHAIKLTPNGTFCVAYTPVETLKNMEFSFRLKNSGNAQDSISAWVFNNGSENGYRAILGNDKIVLSHYENGDYQNRIDSAQATMDENYRDAWHTYTLRCVEKTLTLSVDGTQLLSTTVSENATLENGICLSAWNDSVLIDDLRLTELPDRSEPTDALLFLDFEQESHKSVLTADNWLGYASSQSRSIENEDGNHVLKLIPAPNAFRVSYSAQETVENMELSFKLKNAGNTSDSISAWLYNTGSENGYRVIMGQDKLTLCHYENDDYNRNIVDAECEMPKGYRDTWHTYTLRSVENVLTFSVDGVEKLKTEDAFERAENGFCFSAWNDSVLLDDITLRKISIEGERVAEPVVDKESGAYLDSVSVSISCATEGAALHYTTDGSTPTKDSAVYAAPIKLTKNSTLKVIGIKDGLLDSKIVKRTFSIFSAQLSKDTVNLSVGDVSCISDVYSDNQVQADITASFESDNTAVVTIDSNGFIKAVGVGNATITAKMNVHGKDVEKTCSVSVTPPCNTFYYVAPDGSDANDGSIEKPWATLAHARDVLRTLELPDGGITVYFRDGEYFFEDSVLFTPEDSGEAGKPIVYTSYPGENARFHSGKNLKGWTLLQAEDYPAGLPEAAYGNVYVLDIEPGWRFHDLYASGQRQQVARQINSDDNQTWPGFDAREENWPTLPTKQPDAHEKGMLLKFNPGDMKDLPGNGDVEVYLLTAVWWNCIPVVKDTNEADDTARLCSYLPSILVEWDYCFQHDGDGLGRYNLMNAPKFLDEAGEWCVDSAAGKVYWWPKNTSDLDNAVAPVADELIRLEGDGEDKNWEKQVAYIEFRDLEFSYVDRKGEDELVGENELEPIVIRNSENPYSAIFMRGTANCAIIDCTMRHLGAYAVSMHNYTQNNRVITCTMEDLGCGGVEISGYGPGFVDVNGHNTILNNTVRDTGLAPYEHSAAFTLFGTSYNDIKLNQIENVPYSAIYMAGTNPGLMNPNNFENSFACCDTYGNQGAMNRVREEDMKKVPEATQFRELPAGHQEAAIPLHHLNYNSCSYNVTLEYMLRLNDGGCYYGWHTGYSNEYSSNIAYKSGRGQVYSSAIYLDGGMANSIVQDNVACMENGGLEISDNCRQNNIKRRNVFVSEQTAEAYTTLINTISSMRTGLFGSSSATDDVTPIITIAPTAVDNLILSIGEVTINSGDAIQAARDAYNALTEAQKALVKHLNTLTAAEAKYAELKGESDADAAAAKAVTDLIDAIGDVTLDSKAKIDAARAAYDALTDAQKVLITAETLKKLTDAEAAYAKLKDEADADAAAAKAVTDLIDAIGNVTLDSKAKIDAARAAYDALTDAQKALISAETLKKLTDAEARYAALVASIIPTVPVKPTKPAHNEKPEQSTMRFTDVAENTWYYDGIRFAYENAIMNGVGNGKFEPHADTTRGMIVTMLARMEGVDTSIGKVWYEAGQKWAMENGISDGTNMAGRITREQLATILYRYAKLKGYDVSKTTSLDSFSDAGAVSSYAVDAMRWAVAADLVKGAGGKLDPQGTATRAQVATILMRFSQKIEK